MQLITAFSKRDIFISMGYSEGKLFSVLFCPGKCLKRLKLSCFISYEFERATFRKRDTAVFCTMKLLGALSVSEVVFSS